MAALLTYARESISLFFEYDTPKIVHIQSKKIGIVNRLLQLTILAYIVGFAIIYKKGYQETGPVDSVVTTKVKGVLFTNLSSSELGVPMKLSHLYQRIWDPVDYVIPSSGGEQGGFFIITNIVITPNQTRGKCPEDPKVTEALCTSDEDCERGASYEVGNGVMTGKCVKSRNPSIKTCEIFAWCPVEVDQPPFNGTKGLLEGSKRFTVLVKNAIQFPTFGRKHYSRRNILENSTKTYLQKCIYDTITDPFCPVFRIGDIIKYAGENYTEVAVKGGVFQISISWDCNLDFDFMEYCRPQYSFQRMDSPNALISPGRNFRTAEYHEENRRTLFKNYGIKFLINVEGEAGKFNLVPLLINVGSGLALLGLATIFCDILVLKFLKHSSYYQDKKYLVIKSPDGCPEPEEYSNVQYSQFDAQSSSRTGEGEDVRNRNSISASISGD